MAKFSGTVGFSIEQVEIAPGVFEDQVVERHYVGDLIRNARRANATDQVNLDFSTSNSISVVMDPYIRDHMFAIRFVVWAGVAWIVTDVETERPRLTLRLGGVYHGPRAASA